VALQLRRGGPALENTPKLAQTILKEVNLLGQPLILNQIFAFQ
jgi:hypothetical protein